MNIALVNPEYPSPSGLDQGGIATYTYDMADAFAGTGHSVQVLVKKGTVHKKLHPSVTIHDYLPVPLQSPLRFAQRLMNGDLYWDRCFSIGVKKTLLKITAEKPLDIVEIPEYNGLAFALSSPLPFPVVIHFHTPSALVDRYNGIKLTVRHRQRYAFEEKALSNAAAYRCPSIALATEMSARYGIAADRITFIPHPFDTAPFDAVGKKRTPTVIDILFVGRLERRKGAEILRAAIQPILALDKRIRFTLAGEHSNGDIGLYRNAIERGLSEAERKQVYFIGPVKREDLPVLYCRSSVLCFPSIFENSPYTVLEAMAARLPVVGARCGGIPELIHDNETGLLFNPDNPAELIECIRRLLNDAELLDRFARRAYDVVSTTFKPQTIARQSVDFYTKTIAGFTQCNVQRPKGHT
jgi:glycosyltransferase involved in cell wall biosynthesis